MSENDLLGLLIEADVALHRGAQYIALTAVAFIPHESDDSHTNIGWNAERKRLEGRWFQSIGNEYRLTLSPATYELIWEDRNRTAVERLQLSGSEETEVRDWWNSTAETIGGKSVAELEMNYELPQKEVYTSSTFPTPSSDMVNIWVRWRSFGQKAISVISALMETEIKPRIWPHHFDTGIFGKFNQVASLGCGVSPADGMVDEPYIYLYGWKDGTYMPAPATAIKHGRWIEQSKTGDWSGFILPYSEAKSLEMSDVKLALVQASQNIIEA
ncbi:MAG: hypothetical protein HWD92_13385 [Flavobacteriia bacterium]|nr:hypothetical protein [Flavobacteriia bacterium]